MLLILKMLQECTEFSPLKDCQNYLLLNILILIHLATCTLQKFAFDKVPHQRMLRKLERYGVSGGVLEWIRGWLLDRWQRVGVRGSWSGWRRVLSGIPHGSVLGPVLFLVFIDDLEEGVISGVLKFADDTKIFRRVDFDEDREALQRDLDKLVHWSEVWQMKFNVDKCKVMHMGRGNLGGSYVMNGGTLGVVSEERDLGGEDH